MKREIAQIIWRLNFQFAAIDVQQPAKRSYRKGGEADRNRPKPDAAIAHQGGWNRIRRDFRLGAFARLFCCRTISASPSNRAVASTKKSGDCKCSTAYQR